MRVAAIDCGTNTIKLLIGDVDVATGSTTDVVREARMVRLGEGVDRTGRLFEAALERTFGAVEEYAALVREHGVDPAHTRFCATSATRDADNAEDFADGVEARLGVRPEVLTGGEEARLAWAGSVRVLRETPRAPVLVIDVGGGSTELVLGHDGADQDRPDQAHSMDIGSVRLTERHLHSDPPTPEEVAACVADVDAALDECPVAVADALSVVGVAGTITTLAAGVLGLAAYDRVAIDQSVLDVAAVHRECDRLVGLSVEQRRAEPWMHPGRADVIAAGALIVSRVLARTRATRLVVSESDILDGIAWDLAVSTP
ncbi:Guanosine-5'-triphosphate,3'-diphosphate pyrophosphatase [Nocardioides dokdonensis FR1436]|uniref:Guanosine-5'-triphosphate,3'-diphosphate pyrophosphatase n=1 Tax=Nocardioides dokdonensis FR1436 TaxID=1300347 RepID=A0A1A9GJG5_9ACTN|nr:exopolyphosphatase [Nocardioides dokdonensis]ANH38408.1 Guanosine-5'-triphosphate,3'-diphosphate pyrophosphatase [Nocardioides dokdonensis FR1436]